MVPALTELIFCLDQKITRCMKNGTGNLRLWKYDEEYKTEWHDRDDEKGGSILDFRDREGLSKKTIVGVTLN